MGLPFMYSMTLYLNLKPGFLRDSEEQFENHSPAFLSELMALKLCNPR